jgi:hypothetical protein
MHNVSMYNGCSKILCKLYLYHIKIYQSYIKRYILYFKYICNVLETYIIGVFKVYYIYTKIIIYALLLLNIDYCYYYQQQVR